MNAVLPGLHRELDTPRPVIAQVDMISGVLHVTASGAGRAEVHVVPVHDDDEEAAAYVEQARVEQEGDRVRVLLPHAHPFRRRHPEVRVELVVPERSDLELRSAAVALTTDGPLRDVAVKSASGTLVVDVAQGDVTVRTAASDVEVGEAHGAVSVKSASSRVRVGRADEGLTVVGASGEVHAVRVQGDVRIQSAAGNVRLDAVGVGRVRVDAKMANVEIGVLPDLDVRLDLHSGLGTVDCDLGASDGPSHDGPARGRLDLRATTATGRVHVFASEL